MNKALTILIGFIHDFAAGCWAATVAAVFWLHSQSLAPEAAGILSELNKRFFYAGLVCIFVILATGAGRTFTYIDNVYGAEAERQRRKMLLIKHLFLLVLFGSGTYWQYLMAFGR